MKKNDTIPGIFTVLVGALTLLYVFFNSQMTLFVESKGLELGSGFFPFVCGAGLIVMGVLLTLRGVKQKGKVDYFEITAEKKQNLKVVALLVLLCALMLIAWKISNLFFFCLPVYTFAVNKLLKRSIKFSVVFTVGMTAFIYVLFRLCFTIAFRA